MVKSDSSSVTHDLLEYAKAKQVITDFPKIISIYEKLIPVLYQYAQYQGVWPLIEMTEDSKLLLNMQLKYYKKVYARKGIVSHE